MGRLGTPPRRPVAITVSAHSVLVHHWPHRHRAGPSTQHADCIGAGSRLWILAAALTHRGKHVPSCLCPPPSTFACWHIASANTSSGRNCSIIRPPCPRRNSHLADGGPPSCASRCYRYRCHIHHHCNWNAARQSPIPCFNIGHWRCDAVHYRVGTNCPSSSRYASSASVG
ncbi:hypothetical protein BCR44DRAFT_1247521 [Catenaria anguillulae PL171]|uniref:Uncharacterized protein n=1 Tax=Catenaria anguillulae PL171 TaxID=765915 RepID=A0A1Y2HXT9_9FUNG|nr:hypothetical protein BCR44DRAFT_1247521 [Catenaria anguillulae PL171]